jgi:hypothetical protein
MLTGSLIGLCYIYLISHPFVQVELFGEPLSGSTWATAELQKTRSGTDARGNKTRGYRIGHFDILAACVFNQTGQWRYRFIRARQLEARPDQPDTLAVMQRVQYEDRNGWSSDLRVHAKIT